MIARPRGGGMPLADAPTWLYAAPGQLRAPFRVMCFGAALFLAQGIAESFLGPPFAALSALVGEPIAAYPWMMLVGVLVALGVALGLVDDRPWSTIGVDRRAWSLRALATGAALGGGAIALTVLLLWLTGALRVETTPLLDGANSLGRAWSGTALRLAVMLAPAALWEELVFRGYLWRVMHDAGGERAALWSTSVAFSSVHLLNPGAGVRAGAMVLLAGLCLALLRSQLDSLPAAWAAHLAWNWTMAALLHVPVSGLPFASPGYRIVFGWTGVAHRRDVGAGRQCDGSTRDARCAGVEPANRETDPEMILR